MEPSIGYAHKPIMIFLLDFCSYETKANGSLQISVWFFPEYGNRNLLVLLIGLWSMSCFSIYNIYTILNNLPPIRSFENFLRIHFKIFIPTFVVILVLSSESNSPNILHRCICIISSTIPYNNSFIFERNTVRVVFLIRSFLFIITIFYKVFNYTYSKTLQKAWLHPWNENIRYYSRFLHPQNNLIMVSTNGYHLILYIHYFTLYFTITIKKHYTY